MPTDYDKRLAKDEFDDLVAFLTRQGTSSLGMARAQRTGGPIHVRKFLSGMPAARLTTAGG